MKNTNSKNSGRMKKEISQDQTVEVLYQKLGDRWYAFSLINNEVFVGSLDQKSIEASKNQKTLTKKIAGHS
jgi:hypothetical protein